jgi:translin
MSDSKLKILNDKFTDHFDGVDSARETAIKSGRVISKRSSAIVRKLHSQGAKDVDILLKEMEEITSKYKTLKAGLKKYPELFYSNMVENFIQEYVEATIMLILIKHNLNLDRLPDPDKLGVRYSTYLLGLSDVIGELRRCTLDAIRAQDLIEAGRFMDCMEQLFDVIINLNYPDGVLPLRRKQDVARALIEKTRGELAFAVSEYSLKENISDLRLELNKHQAKVAKSRKN